MVWDVERPSRRGHQFLGKGSAAASGMVIGESLSRHLAQGRHGMGSQRVIRLREDQGDIFCTLSSLPRSFQSIGGTLEVNGSSFSIACICFLLLSKYLASQSVFLVTKFAELVAVVLLSFFFLLF